jgi:hypothetical protein
MWGFIEFYNKIGSPAMPLPPPVAWSVGLSLQPGMVE